MAIPDVPGNVVRTGIALYGQPPSPDVRDLLPLEPVMTLAGQVTRVRRLRRGHGFPSSHFWTAPMDGWGAEVNLGFSASYPRSLAGKAPVLLRGKRCPLVGVIARDASFVFTRERPEIGDDVVFWGRQGDQVLYLYEVASLIQCLAYELPTWLSPRVPRIFTGGTREWTLAA